MRKKSPLNRRETQTLLNTLKTTTIAGMMSLTIAGWGLLAWSDGGTITEAALLPDTKNVAVAQMLPETVPTANAASPQQAARKTVKLNIVQTTRLPGWIAGPTIICPNPLSFGSYWLESGRKRAIIGSRPPPINCNWPTSPSIA